jgi:hypothetical protein
MQLNKVIDQLTELTNGLHEDVKLASTRLEHIRLTARANEAVNILHDLMLFRDAEGRDQETKNDDKTKTTDGE